MSADNWIDCPQCLGEECFREDYEIGIWKGKFCVSYFGSCTKDNCDFAYEFKRTEEIGANPKKSGKFFGGYDPRIRSEAPDDPKI